jgi:DNA-binding response OmpR family regulator
VLLVDREADRFIARRADVDLVLTKPVDPGILRRAVRDLLAALERPTAATGDAGPPGRGDAGDGAGEASEREPAEDREAPAAP